MRISLSLAAALAVAGVSPSLARDCNRASTAVETAICTDPSLAALDRRMSKAYDEVRSLTDPGGRGMLEKAQSDWIRARDESCPASDSGLQGCIVEMTKRRLALLSGVPDSGSPPPGRIIPVFIEQDGTPEQFELAITMLRVLDPKTAADKRLNSVADEIAARAKIGAHGENGHGQVFTSIVTTDFRFASTRLYSVEETFWSYTGGAHGFGGTQSFNFDPVTGRDYGIEDFFTEPAAATLMTACKLQLVAEKKKRLGPDYDPAADTLLQDEIVAEHVATLAAWSFAADAARITFDSESIGSHAEGSYDCVFPMAELKGLALPGSPLP